MSAIAKQVKVNADDAIPVRMIRFVDIQDLPGKAVADNVVMDEQKNRAWHELALMVAGPFARHFRITFHPAGDAPEETCYLHETRVKNWRAA